MDETPANSPPEPDKRLGICPLQRVMFQLSTQTQKNDTLTIGKNGQSLHFRVGGKKFTVKGVRINYDTDGALFQVNKAAEHLISVQKAMFKADHNCENRWYPSAMNMVEVSMKIQEKFNDYADAAVRCNERVQQFYDMLLKHYNEANPEKTTTEDEDDEKTVILSASNNREKQQVSIEDMLRPSPVPSKKAKTLNNRQTRSNKPAESPVEGLWKHLNTLVEKTQMRDFCEWFFNEFRNKHGRKFEQIRARFSKADFTLINLHLHNRNTDFKYQKQLIYLVFGKRGMARRLYNNIRQLIYKNREPRNQKIHQLLLDESVKIKSEDNSSSTSFLLYDPMHRASLMDTPYRLSSVFRIHGSLEQHSFSLNNLWPAYANLRSLRDNSLSENVFAGCFPFLVSDASQKFGVPAAELSCFQDSLYAYLRMLLIEQKFSDFCLMNAQAHFMGSFVHDLLIRSSKHMVEVEGWSDPPIVNRSKEVAPTYHLTYGTPDSVEDMGQNNDLQDCYSVLPFASTNNDISIDHADFGLDVLFSQQSQNVSASNNNSRRKRRGFWNGPGAQSSNSGGQSGSQSNNNNNNNNNNNTEKETTVECEDPETKKEEIEDLTGDEELKDMWIDRVEEHRGPCSVDDLQFNDYRVVMKTLIDETPYKLPNNTIVKRYFHCVDADKQIYKSFSERAWVQYSPKESKKTVHIPVSISIHADAIPCHGLVDKPQMTFAEVKLNGLPRGLEQSPNLMFPVFVAQTSDKSDCVIKSLQDLVQQIRKTIVRPGKALKTSMTIGGEKN